MLAKVKNFVKSVDQFPFNPEQALVFNGEKVFQSFPGGVWTISLFFSLGVLWYQQFY